MPSIVPNRPPCRRCGTPVANIRCPNCGRLHLLRLFTPGWLGRW